MKAAVVLGMNYGDEGKGHVTNFLCGEKTLNVRFNGGGQAAHSVNLSDGRSHVFHHFGSGTLKGARTLLDNHFILNPLVFCQELVALRSLQHGMKKPFLDPLCRVTTPYDSLINQFASKDHRNTCGMGINETVERCKSPMGLTLRNCVDALHMGKMWGNLRTIENVWVPMRLELLGQYSSDFWDFVAAKGKIKDICSGWMVCLQSMIENSDIFRDHEVIDKFATKYPDGDLVFEGAQGLLIDQKRDQEFGTRSNTDTTNAFKTLVECVTPFDMDVYLVTRPYLTRHGDGPLMHEGEVPPYDGIVEPTNPENQYQGVVRYGIFDLEWYYHAFSLIRGQCQRSRLPRCVQSVRIQSAVTCIDQLDEFDPTTPTQSKFVALREREVLTMRISDLQNIGLTSVGSLETDITPIIEF